MIVIVEREGLCSDKAKQKYTITLYNAYGSNKVEWKAVGNELFYRMDEAQKFVWDRSEGKEDTIFVLK